MFFLVGILPAALISYLCRNVNRGKEKKERGGAVGRRRENDERCDVSPSHSCSVQRQQSRAEPAYHCCWRLIGSHTNTHKGSHSLCVTHTRHTALTEVLHLRPVQGDATGWQPLSKSPFLFFSVSVYSDCHSTLRLSSFISHSLLHPCEMASVFSD